MAWFLAKRLVSFTVTLALATIVIFTMLEIVPGDPARLMLGINATQDAVDALRQQMGLDLPPLTR
ncbi:MAG: ABC transporter permease, partial [Nitratireductor sp.]|nr:ABC transporter permease [Nitratireductor sp.]